MFLHLDRSGYQTYLIDTDFPPQPIRSVSLLPSGKMSFIPGIILVYLRKSKPNLLPSIIKYINNRISSKSTYDEWNIFISESLMYVKNTGADISDYEKCIRNYLIKLKYRGKLL